MGKNFGWCYKSKTRSWKKCVQKVVHKTAEATEELKDKITTR